MKLRDNQLFAKCSETIAMIASDKICVEREREKKG